MINYALGLISIILFAIIKASNQYSIYGIFGDMKTIKFALKF